MQAIIDWSNKINIIYPDFTKKINFSIQYIAVSIQKIDTSKLNIFDIVIVFF